MTRRVLLFSSGILMACNTGKVTLNTITEGFDARFVSQVYTWECQEEVGNQTETEGDNEIEINVFPGTYGHEVALYFAPGNLDDLLLNEGCQYGLDIFPKTGGEGASSIEGLIGYPTWMSDGADGLLEGGFGYWFHDVMTNEHTCLDPSLIVSNPIQLQNALGLSGVTVEEHFDIPTVEFESGISTLQVGQDTQIEWSEHQWPRTWVHVRSTKDGEAVEVLTCPIVNGNSFSIDADVWAYFTSELEVDNVELYVGFEHRDVQRSNDGSIVEVLNRVVAVPYEN